MDEQRLRDALRGTGPADPVARERARRVVLAAHVLLEPEPRPRRWAAPLAAALVALVAATGATAVAAPQSGVGRWVRDVLSVERTPAPRPAPGLGSLPGGGRLLVRSGDAVWTVAADGAKRRLGAFDGASWSPQGMFVVAWRGRELTALEPGGVPRWSLSAPGNVEGAWWGPVDGYRVAYVAGGALRIVNGDGTGDRRFSRVEPGIAPAWRPDASHVLALADARGRVTVAAVDLGRRLWRTAPLPEVRAIAWSADGRRLLVATGDRVLALGRHGEVLRSRALPGVAALAAGRGVAAVRDTDTSAEVLLLDRRLRPRRLFTAPGRFGAPTWGPDGRLLVPWPSADQWLFLHPGGSARAAAVGHITRQFAPGLERARFPAAVAWCCAPD